MQHADLFILGGGVIGLSIALEANQRRPDWNIVIADQPTQAGIASRVAAGMLAPYSEFARDSPLFQLARRSFEDWPEFLLRHQLEVPLQREGTLLPLIPGEEERYTARALFLATQGVKSRWLGRVELLEAEPRISDLAAEALWVPECLIHPAELHVAMSDRAAERGITIIPDSISFPIFDGDRITGVSSTIGERWSVGEFVLATGAWSESVGQLFDLALPVIPVRGQLLLLEAPDGFLRHTIHTQDIYLAPRRGYGIVVGATMEHSGFVAAISPAEITDLRRRAAALVADTAALPLQSADAGFRPRSPDGLPIIGRSTRWRNLLIATGHFRNGILLTPITGTIIAGELLGADGPVDFDPARLHL